MRFGGKRCHDMNHSAKKRSRFNNNNNVRSVQTKKQKPSSTGASFRQPGPDDLADMIPLPFLYLLIRGAANGVFNNNFGSRDNLCPESNKLLQHSREGWRKRGTTINYVRTKGCEQIAQICGQKVVSMLQDFACRMGLALTSMLMNLWLSYMKAPASCFVINQSKPQWIRPETSQVGRHHGCHMAVAVLDCRHLALRAWRTLALSCYAAKFDLFLFLDCARVEGEGSNPILPSGNTGRHLLPDNAPPPLLDVHVHKHDYAFPCSHMRKCARWPRW